MKFEKVFLKGAAITFAALCLVLSACKDSEDSPTPAPAPASDPDPVEKEYTGTISNAATTLKAVEGVSGVFTAEFDGDYKLNDIISANLKTADELIDYLTDNVLEWKTAAEFGTPLTINVPGAACSSIVAQNAGSEGGYIYGRNFDWDPGRTLILHTYPAEGYESVSTCYLEFIIDEPDWEPLTTGPEEEIIMNNAIAIGAALVPMDGMNEKGLYIANLQNDTVPVMPAAGDSKAYVQTTVAIRYILDNCKSVDEAVAFLSSINMCPVYADQNVGDDNDYPDYHFAIADNSGNSIVAEWINGEFSTSETKVITNNCIKTEQETPATDEDRDHGTYRRYDSLIAAGEAKQWRMTSEEVTDALEAVQQEHSVWSAVFEPSAKRITYYFRAESSQDSDNPAPIDYSKPVVVQF